MGPLWVKRAVDGQIAADRWLFLAKPNRDNYSLLLLTLLAFLTLCGTAASSKEAEPDQVRAPNNTSVAQPIGGGKPVSTTIIKRCPEGYELVTRANGRHGCAKDVVPANE